MFLLLVGAVVLLDSSLLDDASNASEFEVGNEKLWKQINQEVLEQEVSEVFDKYILNFDFGCCRCQGKPSALLPIL